MKLNKCLDSNSKVKGTILIIIYISLNIYGAINYFYGLPWCLKR